MLTVGILKIPIANKLDIPVISIGSGSPQVAILCGVHGDETSSFLIAKELVNLDVKGTLHLVMGVNQEAVHSGKRYVMQDLNRSFPGDEFGKLEERIAFRLVEFLLGKDLVIDLHCFENKSPVTAIQFKSTDKYVDCFNPKQVWVLDGECRGSLGPFLVSSEIENFAVEMDMIEHLSNSDKDLVVFGIKNVLRSMGMLEGAVVTGSPPRFKRHDVTSSCRGIFVPNSMNEVVKGDVVGSILSIEDLSSSDVVSTHTGVLMQVCRRRLVHPGESLFSVGVRE